MKPVISAGLLMYKINQGVLEVLLGHPGGPYNVDRDEGVWSIPKGQAETNETLLDTAIREFDRLAFLPVPEARRKIERSQVAFFDKLLLLLALSERKTISA